jgi:colicin import membrane protein
MNAIAHNEFAPPPTGGFGKSLSFALFIHLLLLAALTWGIHWKTETQTLSASAELWSAVPAEAAPAANEPEPTPPEPEKPPEPVKKVAPQPEPKPTPTPPKANAAEREAADIALKKEKEKKKLEEKKQAELEKKKKLEKEKLEKEKEKEKEKAKEAEKKKKDEAQKKAEAAAKAKEDAKKAAAEEKRAAALRNENLKRMQGMAGASGDENAKGTAVKSSGPSASYAGRISKIIRDNITFPPDQLSTNPETRVLVTTNSDGLILTRRIIQSSGVKAWDDAVIRALEKTVRLPKDENGRMPDDGFNIAFRPKDN